MSAFKGVLTVVGIILIVLIWMSVFTVDEREKKLVLRFGSITRIVESPGLFFKVPFADETKPVEDRIFMWASDDKAVQVQDKKRYLVDTITVARIADSQKFRQTVGADLLLARSRIETRLDAALRQTYGKRSFEAALSKDRAVMMREIRDQVRNEALALGIDIIDVRIRRTDLMKEVLDATYERMSSERLAEAKDLRGKGTATKTQMQAEADRKAVEKLADANRQSEIIRGEGDAERSRIYADAYNRDPEFFNFYRSMQAYAKSLTNSGTTFVLKPDSEFFKYLGMEKQPAGASPAQP